MQPLLGHAGLNLVCLIAGKHVSHRRGAGPDLHEKKRRLVFGVEAFKKRRLSVLELHTDRRHLPRGASAGLQLNLDQHVTDPGEDVR